MYSGMRLEQSLKTTQQMILSPQMQQAIQILQMPIMDLRLKVAQEMAVSHLRPFWRSLTGRLKAVVYPPKGHGTVVRLF